MKLKKHIGFTCTLIGIMIPLFGTVSSASNGGKNTISYSSIHFTEITSVNKEEVPLSDNSIKQDIDFINRLKTFQLSFRYDRTMNRDKLNRISPSEPLLVSSFSVPRPAYYNFLFMFKPFE